MIYWSDWGNNASISEARMNGDERRVIVHFNQSAWPNGLAIDIKGNACGWAACRWGFVFCRTPSTSMAIDIKGKACG